MRTDGFWNRAVCRIESVMPLSSECVVEVSVEFRFLQLSYSRAYHFFQTFVQKATAV